MTDLASRIAAFEAGELNHREQVDLFAELVRTGLAWTLQGTYGRCAQTLIRAGYVSAEGDVLGYGDDELGDGDHVRDERLPDYAGRDLDTEVRARRVLALAQDLVPDDRVRELLLHALQLLDEEAS